MFLPSGVLMCSAASGSPYDMLLFRSKLRSVTVGEDHVIT